MRTLASAVALVALGVAGTTAGRAAQTPAPGAVDLAARLQAHYSTVRNFTAGFTQTFEGGFTPQKSEFVGDVKIMKPDMMRWTYTKPEKNEWLADGTHIYMSEEASPKRVERTLIPRGKDVSTALLFLAGRGDLVRDFTPSLLPDGPAGEWRLKLMPKNPQADFTSLTLVVDPKSLRFLGFVTDENGRTNTIRFKNLRENVNLSAGDFKFVKRPGVEIIDR